MKQRISQSEICEVFSAAKSNNFITAEDTVTIFYDIDFLKERIVDIKNSFPTNTLHAVAVKANPLLKILVKFKDLDTGLEVASLPELYLALNAGFKPERIVFDSPAKTVEEISFALSRGININADSLREIDRIAKQIQSSKPIGNIGLRVNPQVGTGTIVSTSVADKISKFGVPIDNNRTKIIEHYLKHSWLNTIHVHIGSQGCPISLLVEGIKKIVLLAEEINTIAEKELGTSQIKIIDIGGGLPVSYHFDEVGIEVLEYKNILEKEVPQLFTGNYGIVTEFGRYIHANTAWATSRVEYVKDEGDYCIVTTHLGADFLVRKCYNPNDWHHEITVIDKNGNQKSGKTRKYIIAGPLCFAGDIIAKDIELPLINEGDFLVIHDVGAYTLAMWSRYNSREIPKVIGYSKANSSFEIVRKRETKDDLLKFWS